MDVLAVICARPRAQVPPMAFLVPRDHPDHLLFRPPSFYYSCRHTPIPIPIPHYGGSHGPCYPYGCDRSPFGFLVGHFAMRGPNSVLPLDSAM